ncbi:MAG: YqjK-like family protein [Halomonas sp.]|nr:YqjK family protein [Halomonas sp.]MDN6297202.1 YqjK-like family protein [Halomonas sp.]MDN6314296.1 YqjK-like family protein [Halomonas sp.]MDN6335936.1 YqjK-like family protein [Halomonas sp.]
MPARNADPDNISQNAPRPLSRAARKRELLDALEQQRIDIMVEGIRLERAAAPLDRGFLKLARHKTPLMLAASGVAYRIVRKPGPLVRIGKRGLAAYMLVRNLKRLGTPRR